jgi:hypothetical protein
LADALSAATSFAGSDNRAMTSGPSSASDSRVQMPSRCNAEVSSFTTEARKPTLRPTRIMILFIREIPECTVDPCVTDEVFVLGLGI